MEADDERLQKKIQKNRERNRKYREKLKLRKLSSIKEAEDEGGKKKPKPGNIELVSLGLAYGRPRRIIKKPSYFSL